jgi:hypothetical protein
MPIDGVMRGYSIRVSRGLIPVGAGENGEPKVEPRWVFAFVDRQSGDTLRFAFDDEVRDYVVRELTGGVVLAGGNLPKLPPNPRAT